jgi:hypothetical protein
MHNLVVNTLGCWALIHFMTFIPCTDNDWFVIIHSIYLCVSVIDVVVFKYENQLYNVNVCYGSSVLWMKRLDLSWLQMKQRMLRTLPQWSLSTKRAGTR